MATFIVIRHPVTKLAFHLFSLFFPIFFTSFWFKKKKIDAKMQKTGKIMLLNGGSNSFASLTPKKDCSKHLNILTSKKPAQHRFPG